MVVLRHFQDIFQQSCTVSSISLPTLKKNPLKIVFDHDAESVTVFEGQKPLLPFARSEVFLATISSWRRHTPIDIGCKAVYEITFNTSGSNFSWTPGDTIGIVPHNIQSDVNFIIKHLELNEFADASYSLTVVEKGKIPPHVPVKSTIRHVLTHCLDFRSVVKKLFLLALSSYTTDISQKRALEYLCSKEGSSAYTEQILNKYTNILDIFEIFPSCKPPLEVLLVYLPRLFPRPYSIVNSMLKDKDKLKICFSVTELANGRKGLATGWLEQMVLEEKSLELRMESLCINEETPHKVPIYMRKNISGFCLPKEKSTPLVLIGTGTGITPFIGFLEELKAMRCDNSINIGAVWLFFGCRNPNLDFLFKDELHTFVDNGTLSKMCTAFSRVENNGIKYVQDALLHHSSEIVNLIENGANIFVCGDHKVMSEQIKKTLLLCLQKEEDTTPEQAEKILTDMQKDKRYLVDIWS